MRAACLLLFLLTTFASAASAQQFDRTEEMSAVEIYLAKDDGSGNAGEEATEFVPTDVPIFCIVELGSSESVNVRMNLVAVSVPGVKADSRVVSINYTTKNGEDRVSFRGHPEGKWVAGKYRVDIFIGEEAAGSREFTVRKLPRIPKPPIARRLAIN